MNGFERINAALNGRKPDKVPVMLHNFMMAAAEAGISMREFRQSPRNMAEVFIRSVEKYQFDGILVDVDTVTLAGAVGVPVDFPEHEPARSAHGMLADLKDFYQLKPIKIEDYKYVQIWLEGVRLMKEKLGGEIFVRGNCDQAPFSLASMMRGSQSWMLDLLTEEPQMITDLLNYCAEISCQFIRLMAQTGCDMVSNGDSPAGPEMISPEMYREFALPYEEIVVAEARKLNLPYCLHICGNTDTILEDMVQSGAIAFELDFKTNAQLAHSIFNDKVCFIGNIDPSGVLALGTPEKVKEKTVELLTIFKDSNRFILNAGCAIPSSTPPVNLKTMIKTARDFG